MSDSNEIIRNQDGSPKLPDWIVKMAEGMQSLREVDALDDMIMTLPAEQLKQVYSKLDLGVFQQFLEWQMENNPCSPLKLTSLLRINGRPFTLAKHPFFEPLFYPDLPDSLLLVCGRQVGKSTGLAAQGVLQGAAGDGHFADGATA
jgi:hypothetical protein